MQPAQETDSSNMSDSAIEVEHISLKRLERKLWQYENCEPKRVELAVLDYLAASGWRGYFTEHFEYDRTILVMMLWCNSSNYLSEKRNSLKFEKGMFKYGHYGSIFNFATDGIYGFDTHKFSCADIMRNAELFSAEMIKTIFDLWCHRGVKGGVIGNSYYRKYFSDRLVTDLKAEDLVSFYNARGGLPYYLDFINTFFGPKLQLIKGRYRSLNRQIREKYSYNHPLFGVFLKEEKFLNVWGQFPTAPSISDIQTWVDEIIQIEKTEFHDQILELASEILDYWLQRSEIPYVWREKKAILDLVVWKDTVTSVEVKAPNDRLGSHQKEQLQLDAGNGMKPWVIQVHESTDMTAE